MGDVERVVRGERKSCDSVDAIQPSCGEFAAPQNQTEETFLWRSTEISFDCSNVGEINASGRKNFKRVSRTIPVFGVGEPGPFPIWQPYDAVRGIKIFAFARVAMCCILSPPSTYRKTSMGGSAPPFSAPAEPIPSRFTSLIPGGKLGSRSTKGGRVLTTCRQLIGVARGRHDIHAEWCQTTGRL